MIVNQNYNDRAKEYDKVYAILAEQEDLNKHSDRVFPNIFAQQIVLEIIDSTRLC